MGAAIQARGLTKRFGERVAVVDLDLDVAQGEVFGFLGPNGAGKTTTVRMLTSLLRPTSGEAEVAGVPVTPENGPELRRRIGVMPENPGLYLKLTVWENLEFFAGLYGVDDPADRIDYVLQAVGLASRRDELAGSLSKGLRQRAALARALLAEPEVLFLDEPTAGLDPEATVEVRGLIDGLRSRGITVFLTTHRLEEAERLCDRVAIINTRLITLGRTKDLLRGGGDVVEIELAAPLPDPERVFSLEGVLGWSVQDGVYRVQVANSWETTPRLVRALVTAGADVLRVAEPTRRLEEVYLEIVGEEGR